MNAQSSQQENNRSSKVLPLGYTPLKSAPKVRFPTEQYQPPPVAAPKDASPLPDMPPVVAEPQPVVEKIPTEAQLQEAWLLFAERYKQDKPLVANMLTWKPISFAYPVITHALRMNATDASYFKEVRNELLGFLKKQLNNSRLELTTIEVAATENTGMQKLYTNSERFNFMADQNPLLHDLRHMLGLDIE
ncbi:hypothetical protein [Rhodoflexus sp.]